MPVYTVRDPQSGRTVKLRGDSPPTEQELEEVFAKVGGGASAQPQASPSQQGPQEPAPGLFGRLLPESRQAAIEAGKSGESVSLGQTAGNLFSDIASAPRRLVGAGADLVTGTLKGGLGQGVRQADEELQKTEGEGLLENINRALPGALLPVPGAQQRALAQVGRPLAQRALGQAAEGGLQAAPLAVADRLGGKATGGQALGQLAMGGGLGGALTAGSGLIRESLPQFGRQSISTLSQVPEEALQVVSNPQTLQRIQRAMQETGGDLRQVADQVGLSVDQVQSAIDRQFQKSLGQRLGADVAERPSPAQSGQRLEQAAEQAAGASGQRFQQIENQALRESGAADARLLFSPRKGKQGVQNPLENAVDDFIQDINFDAQKGFGKIGNRIIPEEALREIQGIKQQFSAARNTQDMIDMRRLLDQKINFGGKDQGPLFPRGSDSDFAMNQVRKRINSSIEDQIERSVGEETAELWRANNKLFSQTRQMLDDIRDTAKVGKVATEAYTGKLKDIGARDLSQMKQIMTQDEALRPLWQEMSRGYRDNLIMRGFKDGQFDAQAFAKAWKNADQDILRVMMDEQQIQGVGRAIGKFERRAGFGRSLRGDRQRLASKLENVGSKAQREAKDEIELIDRLMGTNFSQQADDVFRGKQLGVTETGNVPKLNPIGTGRSDLGRAIGATVGAGVGSVVGQTPGALVGVPLGGLAGLYLQSPAGAIVMTSLLNRLRPAIPTGAPSRLSAIVRAGLSGEQQ